MLAAVANTSSVDLHDGLRTTDKFTDLVASFINSRQGIIRPPSSLLIDDKEKIGGQTKEELAQYYSPRTSNSLTFAKKFDVGGAIRKGLRLAKDAILSALIFALRLATKAIFYPLIFLLKLLFPDVYKIISAILFLAKKEDI